MGLGRIFDFGIGTVGGGGSVSTLGTDARISGLSVGVVGGSIVGGGGSVSTLGTDARIAGLSVGVVGDVRV